MWFHECSILCSSYQSVCTVLAGRMVFVVWLVCVSTQPTAHARLLHFDLLPWSQQSPSLASLLTSCKIECGLEFKINLGMGQGRVGMCNAVFLIRGVPGCSPFFSTFSLMGLVFPLILVVIVIPSFLSYLGGNTV